MAAQTVLNAVNANTPSAAVDVNGPFSVTTVGLRPGEAVSIQLADTDVPARYNQCGVDGLIADQTGKSFQVFGAWKVRAVPIGLKSDSALTVIVNQ